MLEPLFGSTTRERVLVFVQARQEGYGLQIAEFYKADVAPVQRQLDRLESGGVLVSRRVGRTRVYSFNPQYPFLAELQALLGKALKFYPKEFIDRLKMS